MLDALPVEVAEDVARLMKALGDPTRLRMLALLSCGELCVCHIEAALGLPQPTVSRQLTILKVAGLVTARREGSWIHYRLADQDEHISRRVLRSLFGKLPVQRALARNIARLRAARGPQACGPRAG